MSSRPETGPLLTLAERAETAGFDSVWIGDSITARPRHEPLTLLAAVAARTRRVAVGTAVLLPALRNPVVTAKAVATLDHLAGGRRVLLGIGVGWLAEEFATLGVPFADRGERTDEYVAAMRALWRGRGEPSEGAPSQGTQECASFHGRFVNFDNVFCRPLPPERRIPIIVGGDTPHAARRAGRLGDGYFPARGAPQELFDEMRRAAEAAGRDPKAIELTVAAPADPKEIEALAKRGITRVGVPVNSSAGLPAQVKTPEDVLRYGKDVIARFR